jgi:hypothetical protein
MLEAIVTDNQRAKQTMNAMYLDQTGAKSKVSVINFFSKGVIPFQVFSIIFSAFGFYFDLLDAFGIIGSIVVGVFLGLFIEASKHHFVKGAFTSFSPAWKVSMSGGAFIFLVIALSYHYKSLQTFQNISVRADLQTQVNKETETLNKKLDAISATQANNKALTFVFGNGTSRDDKEATESILSNNQLAIQLAKMGNETSSAAALLKQSEKTAKQNTNTLLFLFITVEIFSLFGLIAKGLINSETSDAVKSVVTTSEKLTTLEENVVQVVETKLIDTTMKRIEEAVNTKHPTPPQNSYNQLNNPQIGFTPIGAYKMPINPYLMATYDRLNENPSEPKFLPIINKRNPISKGTRTISDDHLKQNFNECSKEAEEKVVDLLKFSPKEGEFIKLLWDNGEVKKDDKLIPKRFILEQSFKGRGTERELVNLYAKLEDMNLILFKNGYRALANMENIVTQKVG